MLNDAGKHYGEGIIKNYSNKLRKELNKKYDVSSLNKMRKFYYLVEKMATVSPNLSYSHYVELLSYENINKVKYYIKISEKEKLSVRQLRLRIKSKEYERLSENTKKKIIENKKTEITDFVKDSILIKGNGSYEMLSEKVLQKLVLEDIENFMKELGNSFSFIGSEYKIKIGSQYNYIDLLLFNIEFNCYVIVELKVTELRKEHIGQIQVYMNYIDKNLKNIYQDKTIGIIICRVNNQYIIEYSSDKRIISREFQLKN